MLELAVGENKEVVLMGDLNVNLLSKGHLVSAWSLITEEFCLSQLISEPTRVCATTESLLDVIYSTNSNLFTTTGTLSLSNSDHLMVYGERTEVVKVFHKYSQVRCFKNSDVESFCADLSRVPWDTMDVFTSVDDKWDCWRSLFLSVVNDHFPIRSVRLRRTSLKWITPRITQLMRARNYFHTKFRRTGLLCDWNKYKSLKKMVVKELRRAKMEYFADIGRLSSGNSGKGWSSLSKAVKPKCRGHIGCIRTDAGDFNSADDIVALLNDHFSALFRSLPLPSINQPEFTSACTFHFAPVSADIVFEALNSLVISKATGPDGLSARILKMAAAAIAGSLTRLFNVSLTTGDFPMDWKKANVYPVFKSGDPCLRTNYRPISVLSIIAKVFETVVHQQVTSYFISNNLFAKAQSGFRSGHSTQDVLLRVTEDWKLALDDDNLVGIMFIDLSKAFDSIDHSLLIAKLSAYGFDKISLQWFSAYLSNRQQRVVLDHVYSDWATVMRGVPQGSVLGPLLFIIYMNDLPAVLQHSHMNLFADDIALYVMHSDPDILQTYLNHDLRLVFQWVASNGFKVNVSKSQSLLLASRHRRDELSSLQIFLDGNLIRPNSCVKYLGVLVDSDLAWTNHIQSVRKVFSCFISDSQD